MWFALIDVNLWSYAVAYDIFISLALYLSVIHEDILSTLWYDFYGVS